jgi:hypothetical protein
VSNITRNLETSLCCIYTWIAGFIRAFVIYLTRVDHKLDFGQTMTRKKKGWLCPVTEKNIRNCSSYSLWSHITLHVEFGCGFFFLGSLPHDGLSSKNQLFSFEIFDMIEPRSYTFKSFVHWSRYEWKKEKFSVIFPRRAVFKFLDIWHLIVLMLILLVRFRVAPVCGWEQPVLAIFSLC